MITKRTRQKKVFAQESGCCVSGIEVARFGGSSVNSQKPHEVNSGAKYIASYVDLTAVEHNVLGSLS